jgi:hypothetical protein
MAVCMHTSDLRYSGSDRIESNDDLPIQGNLNLSNSTSRSTKKVLHLLSFLCFMYPLLLCFSIPCNKSLVTERSAHNSKKEAPANGHRTSPFTSAPLSEKGNQVTSPGKPDRKVSMRSSFCRAHPKQRASYSVGRAM